MQRGAQARSFEPRDPPIIPSHANNASENNAKNAYKTDMLSTPPPMLSKRSSAQEVRRERLAGSDKSNKSEDFDVSNDVIDDSGSNDEMSFANSLALFWGSKRDKIYLEHQDPHVDAAIHALYFASSTIGNGSITVGILLSKATRVLSYISGTQRVVLLYRGVTINHKAANTPLAQIGLRNRSNITYYVEQTEASLAGAPRPVIRRSRPFHTSSHGASAPTDRESATRFSRRKR